MSRIEGLVIALGLLLIGFGLAVGHFTDTPTDEVGRDAPDEAAGGEGDSSGGLGPGADTGAAAIRREAPRPRAATGNGSAPGPPELELRLSYEPDGGPVQDAEVEVWRRATGEGASYRSARRLISGRRTDASGTVELTGPPGFALDVFCRISSEVPPLRVAIEPLEAGEARTVTRSIARPPEPLEIVLTDERTGDPIAGASVRAASRTGAAPEDFPGESRLLARTASSGRCTIKGRHRSADWLLIDAAGYGPAAVRPLQVRGETSIARRLQPSAEVNFTVVNADGDPIVDAEVDVLYSVDGYVATTTSRTNRHGKATLRRLPAGTQLEPRVTPEGASPIRYASITLNPGDSHDLGLSVTAD